MTAALDSSVAKWARAGGGPGATVESVVSSAMLAGTVARALERIDVTVASPTGEIRTVSLVRKWTWAHEVLGLRAAQAVIDKAPAIPHLIADGEDERGVWLITPFYAGGPASNGALPASVFESLAVLHSRYSAERGGLVGIPAIDAGWWRDLCLSHADPAVERQAALTPHAVLDRARGLLVDLAEDDRVAEILARLPRTLLHGDVHAGNILVPAASGEATLIDWGSARTGPAMLDLANVTSVGSVEFSAYARAWERSAGRPLDPQVVELGYRWAALQIPIQYLAWVVSTRPPQAVAQALDRVEAALAAL